MLHDNIEHWYGLYQNGHTLGAIGKMVGYTGRGVALVFKKYGLKTHPRTENVFRKLRCIGIDSVYATYSEQPPRFSVVARKRSPISSGNPADTLKPPAKSLPALSARCGSSGNSVMTWSASMGSMNPGFPSVRFLNRPKQTGLLFVRLSFVTDCRCAHPVNSRRSIGQAKLASSKPDNCARNAEGMARMRRLALCRQLAAS